MTQAGRAAQNGLDDAVRAYCAANDYEGILSGYVLVMAHTIVIDGDDATAYACAYQGGSMPYHAIIGLLDLQRERLVREAAQDGG